MIWLALPLLVLVGQTDADKAIEKCNQVNSGVADAMAWQGLGHASMSDDYAVDASISETLPFCMGYSVESIARDLPSNTRGRDTGWVIRRVTSFNNAPARVFWASARDCPAVLDAIETLTRIQFSIGFAAATRPTDQAPVFYPPVMDGVSYTAQSHWARQPDGSALDISISASSGSLVLWKQTTDKALANCWRSTEPVRHRL